MRFCPIASGSSGNCVYVGAGESHSLVDAGLSGKRIEEALGLLEIPRLTGILVTHEHSDHILGAGVISRRFKVPIFATPNTWRYFLRHGTIGTIAPELQRIIVPGEAMLMDGIEVLPFDIPHDSSQPVGFCLFADGYKAAIATDLGYATDTVTRLLRDTHVLLLECNHDIEMLQNGRYPRSLKERVMGHRGHLSNVAAGALLAEIATDTLEHVFLGHLSEENNRPMIALDTVQRILEVNNVTIKGISVAERHIPSEMIQLNPA